MSLKCIVPLQVFLPERDLVAGTIEHSASVEIIDQRCDKAIPILSPSFLASPITKVYTDLAQYLGITKQRTVVIPVLFKKCDSLPGNLSMISKIKYEPSSKLVNFYERLFGALHLKGVNPKLLEYPAEFAGNRIAPPKPSTATPVSMDEKPPQLPSIAQAVNPGFEDFTDLNTVSTTISELDSVSTTVSEMSTHSQAMLLAKDLPKVPTHDPGEASGTSGKKSSGTKSKNPLKSLTKAFSGKKNAYLA